MRTRVAGMIVGAVVIAAACGATDNSVADPSATTAAIADPTTSDVAPTTTVIQSTTIAPDPPSVGVEPLAGLLRSGDIGGWLYLERPGSPSADSAEVGFTAGDGSVRSDDAIEVFGAAINEVSLIGTGWVNGDVSGLTFHTDDPASVVETVLSDPRWPTPEPIESGLWTTWALGDEIDLSRRSLVRPGGAGGLLAVGRVGTEVEGWIAFEYDARDQDARREIDEAGAAFVAAAPFMTAEWDSAVIESGSFDVAQVLENCPACADEDRIDAFRALYGPTRTIRAHAGIVYLVSPERLRVVIVHTDEATAEVTEVLAPVAIANTQGEGQPSFQEVLAFTDIERSGTAVTIDFDIVNDRIDPLSVAYGAFWTRDTTRFWGPG